MPAPKDLSPTAFVSNAGKMDLLEAIDLLNQAIAQDPAFFEAYCQLVSIQDVFTSLATIVRPARLAIAEAAVQAAFRLRPDAGRNAPRAGGESLLWISRL